MRILEVGAGIGNLSQLLPLRECLYLTESDPHLLARLKINAAESFGDDARVTVAMLDLAMPPGEELKRQNIDTAVSFNVLEHIQDDTAALRALVELLTESSARKLRIVSLVPAHAWAFGAMDRAYGHFRRYSKRGFARLASRAAPGWEYTARYFNVVGLPGWLVMGKWLGTEKLDSRAVDAFDKLCPYIRGLDDLLHVKLRLPLGQSLLAVITLDRS